MDDELFDLLAPTVASFGLELLDVEVKSRLVRVVVDGPGGAGLSAISDATRAVSAALDGHDPMPGERYTLEVSSPGVERPLRTPEHFARAVGETVSVRTRAGEAGERRVTGVLTATDASGFVLSGDGLGDDGRRFAYAEIERARTVFEWGPASTAPRRTGGRARRGGSGQRGTHREKVTTP